MITGVRLSAVCLYGRSSAVRAAERGPWRFGTTLIPTLPVTCSRAWSQRPRDAWSPLTRCGRPVLPIRAGSQVGVGQPMLQMAQGANAIPTAFSIWGEPLPFVSPQLLAAAIPGSLNDGARTSVHISSGGGPGTSDPISAIILKQRIDLVQTRTRKLFV